jgi:hypothetical protein
MVYERGREIDWAHYWQCKYMMISSTRRNRIYACLPILTPMAVRIEVFVRYYIYASFKMHSTHYPLSTICIFFFVRWNLRLLGFEIHSWNSKSFQQKKKSFVKLPNSTSPWFFFSLSWSVLWSFLWICFFTNSWIEWDLPSHIFPEILFLLERKERKK